ncbi:hypothetical protein [Clostridium algidicarnis]|uniref:hypothetical protein n=1 Tax=Clostridium algidicarnis TaxID=37659 RepID=UPI0016240FB3|nr:hypothetical protein [Clostridium algidicarnis]MBB6696268.1 hypothetical protein [Clostridium algidicarnis]
MLSETLGNNIGDFIEQAEEQESYIQVLEDRIQEIVNRCEHVLRFEPLTKVGKGILEEIIEEFKEEI